MTTLTYEEKLGFFAAGKRLRRFRGTLRASGQSACDACGSSLPSYLHGLRDMATGKDYFVGGNCLIRLNQMLALERPYVRSNLASAYLRSRGVPDRAILAPPPPADVSVPHPCCIHGKPENGTSEVA